MLNYIRAFLRNEKYIFEIICIIIFVIILTRILNSFYKDNEPEETQKQPSVYEKFSEEQVKGSNDIIDNFIQLCRDNAYAEAYALLSNDCKFEIYKNEDEFKKEYESLYIKGLEEYEKNIVGYKENAIIYRVKYQPNAIETGLIDAKIDYISVLNEENGNQSLNVVGFIKKEKLQKEYNSENIKIQVKEKTTFCEYEIYNIEVINSSNSEIKLNPNTIICIDEKENYYYSEYAESTKEMVIHPQTTQELEIKISKDAIKSGESKVLQIQQLIVGGSIDGKKIVINL